MTDANPLVEVVDGADRFERRAQIAALEDRLIQYAAEHGVETGLRHLFASGVYVREAFLPACTLAIGKLHKLPHITVLLQGRVTITTEEGSNTYEAPQTLVAPAGIKRVAYAHTDVIWQSIHNVGDERDLEIIEALLIAKDFSDPALHQEERLCLS